MELSELKQGLKSQDRLTLAKALSLAESQKKEHEVLTQKLISSFEFKKFSRVIGVSGLPGVGKSSFLNIFIKKLVDQDLKVAVLAIDPSSDITGGSILGDKTRMSEINSLENVFIRPSSNQGNLGGVSPSTFRSIRLCEAFGFDYIFVETVGVGQSESLVSKMVDFFILMIAPTTGDDLQGIKRGVLEHVHQLIVHKADGENLELAKNTAHLYQHSSDLLTKTDLEVRIASFFNHQTYDFLFGIFENFFQNYRFKSKREQQSLSLKRFDFQIKFSRLFDEYYDKNMNFEKFLETALKMIK